MATEMPSEPAAERTIHALDALRVYFDPLRTRIIHALSEPCTLHQVAAALDVPFTRLYYHFQLLEKHGFIRQVDAKSFGGAVEEKVYQISARVFLVDRALMTVGESDEAASGLTVVLESVLDRTKDDIRQSARAGVIDLDQRSPDPRALFIMRGYSYLSPERAAEFYVRLRALVDEYVTAGEAEVDEPRANGRYYGLSLALYPSAMQEAPVDPLAVTESILAQSLLDPESAGAPDSAMLLREDRKRSV